MGPASPVGLVELEVQGGKAGDGEGSPGWGGAHSCSSPASLGTSVGSDDEKVGARFGDFISGPTLLASLPAPRPTTLIHLKAGEQILAR